MQAKLKALAAAGEKKQVAYSILGAHMVLEHKLKSHKWPRNN